MKTSSALEPKTGRHLYLVPEREIADTPKDGAPAILDDQNDLHRTPNLMISEKARERIQFVLKRNHGDRIKTAEDLSVPTSWIDALIIKYKLEK